MSAKVETKSEESKEVEVKPKHETQRQFLNFIADKLYLWCRGYSYNVTNVITILLSCMHTGDEELEQFLEQAKDRALDPRYHDLWQEWPDLKEGPMHKPESDEVKDLLEFTNALLRITDRAS
jgi:hypothetical protein